MFFDVTRPLRRLGEELVGAALAGFGGRGLTAEHFALTLIVSGRRFAEADGDRPQGWSWNGDRPFYPCSVVKVFYLAAVQAALERGDVAAHEELDRAMRDMIRWSSNTATNYVIDLVTGTTGDTLLDEAAMTDWIERRGAVNRWLRTLGRAEFEALNVCQKLMDDDRYGRERVFARLGGNNHNRLTTEATARIFHDVFTGRLISPKRSRIVADLLARPHDAEFAAHPSAQVTGYFGEGLPAAARLWSKCGRTEWTGDVDSSWRRHDSAHVELPGGGSFIMVAFTEGREISCDPSFLPSLSADLCRRLEECG
jgi:beta-lactamase class A